MRIRFRASMLCLLGMGLFPNVPLFAQGFDRVTLKDGSVLLGKLQKMVDGKLEVETAFGIDETVSVKWSEVANLRTSADLPFVLKDGSRFVGTAEEGAEGKIAIRLKDLAEPLTVTIDSVAAINPPEKKPVTYNGNLNFGASVADGNTQTKTASFSGEFVARSKRQRLTLRAAWNYAEDQDGLTARNTKGSMKYDFFVTERFFLFASALFEEDKFQDLNLRTALAAGPGYQFIQEGDFTEEWLSGLEAYGEVGLAFFDEDFKRGEDQRYLSARWAVKIDWAILPKLTLFHNHEGYPGLEDASDLYITTETGVRLNIWANFIATLQVNWRWDNTPSPGFERSDTLYLMTLGYAFSF